MRHRALHVFPLATPAVPEALSVRRVRPDRLCLDLPTLVSGEPEYGVANGATREVGLNLLDAHEQNRLGVPAT